MHRITIFLILLCCYSAEAQQRPLDDGAIQQVKRAAAEASKKTVTISSDFTQEKEMSILNDKITSTGKFYFKKDRLLRWEYEHPFSYV
ncbi:outer membrane lipoprotein carrier protein LolA, partial [Bacteroidota bacterium]